MVGGGFRKLPLPTWCLLHPGLGATEIKVLKPWFASPVGCPVKPTCQGQMGHWCPAAGQSCKLAASAEAGESVRILFPSEGFCVIRGEKWVLLDQKIPPTFTQQRYFSMIVKASTFLWIFGHRSVIFGRIQGIWDFLAFLQFLRLYLSNTVHVAVAFALSPDLGSMSSWKTEPDGSHSEDGTETWK